MGEIDDGNIERLLQQVTPRGAPRELRERTLSRIQAEAEHPAMKSQVAVALSDCLGRVAHTVGIANATVAASLCVAIFAYFGSKTIQDHRIAALLGPSPASNRVGEIMETIRPIADAKDLEPWHEQLRSALASASRRETLRCLVSSEPLLTMESLRDDKAKANRTKPDRPHGDTTLNRHRPQLEVARTV